MIYRIFVVIIGIILAILVPYYIVIWIIGPANAPNNFVIWLTGVVLIILFVVLALAVASLIVHIWSYIINGD